MLKLLFNRHSKIVYTLEIVGVLLTIGWAMQIYSGDASSTAKFLVGFYIFEYLLLRFCAAKRWYRGAKRHAGIELQFKKGMIPTAYLMTLSSGIGWATGSLLTFWLTLPVMTTLAYVNIVLLDLHFRDKTTTPVNYFSNNEYLRTN